MLKTKENKIIFLIVTIIAFLIYIFFLTGYYSVDTEKIVNLGYDGYAINYSFYDGRIIMGIICMIANSLNINLKVFYIILLSISILISSITVLKIYDIISKYKKTGIKQKIILVIISFCYIFNFMTINNMEFIECIVMAISVLLYILTAENIIIKKNPKKAFIYAFIAGIAYQGTINILFITTILFALLENNKQEKTENKKIIYSIICVIIAIILNIVIKQIMEIIIESTMQSQRLNANIFWNIGKIFKEMPLLIIDSLYLFPKYAYIIFNIGSLIIIYIYCIKNKQIKIWYNTLFLFVASIVSSLILLIIFDGLQSNNGRIFGSVGASFSIIWIYVYIKTDIFDNRGVIEKISIILITTFFILNCYNILENTKIFKTANELDQELAKNIANKIEEYEIQTNKKIKYIEIKYSESFKEKVKNYNTRAFLKSRVLTGNFSHDILKAYTNIDLEKRYFEEEHLEKVKDEPIVCEDETVYVLIK